MTREGRQLESGLRMVPHFKTQEEVDADDERVRRAMAELSAEIAQHDSHRRSQVGRCLYCDDCGVRLYQGTLPEAVTPTPPPLHLLGRVPRAER